MKFVLTWSILSLLMPWLLVLPGHQQTWYWWSNICAYFPSLRETFKYQQMKCDVNYLIFYKNKSVGKGLRVYVVCMNVHAHETISETQLWDLFKGFVIFSASSMEILQFTLCPSCVVIYFQMYIHISACLNNNNNNRFIILTRMWLPD